MGFYDNNDDNEIKGFGYNGGDYIDPLKAGPGHEPPKPEPPKHDAPRPEPPKAKPPKKKRPVLRFVGKTVAAALIFCLVASAGFYGLNKAFNIIPVSTGGSGTTAVSTTADHALAGAAVSTAVTVNDVADLVENVIPSIVKVTNVSVRQYQGFFGQLFEQEYPTAGSGFVVGEDDSYVYIATNNHVVSNSKDITITFFDDEAAPGEVQGAYQDKDVAVARVSKSDIPADTLEGIRVSSLGNSDNVKVGQGSVVIGNALGYGISVSAGIISALNREVSVRDDTGYLITNNLIQTDASVNAGNSGGPLLNLNGEVIGIVSVRDYTNEADNIGYAIPINQAAEIMDELIASGSYNSGAPTVAGAYLGIYGGMDIDKNTAKQYDMPVGVYVSSVVSDSPAESAGIQKGDVITAFENKTIETMSQLQAAIAEHEPGDEVSVTFAIASNRYMEKTAMVTLAKRPEENN